MPFTALSSHCQAIAAGTSSLSCSRSLKAPTASGRVTCLIHSSKTSSSCTTHRLGLMPHSSRVAACNLPAATSAGAAAARVQPEDHNGVELAAWAAQAVGRFDVQLARRWSGRVARQVQAAEQLAAGIVAAEAAALLAGNEMAREQQEVVYILRHSTAVGASQPTDQLPTANHPNQQPSHLEVSPELTDSVSKAAAGAASAAQAAGPAILNLGAKALGALVMTGAMVHTVVESVADGSSSSGSSGSSSGDRGACFAAPARSDDCSAAAVAASSSAAAAIDAAAVTAMAATADVVAAAAATTTVTPASTVTTVAATAAPAISDESSASDAAAAAASAPCSSSTSATASATSSATSPTTSTAPTTPTASTTTAVRATLVKFLPPSPATLTQQLQQQGTAADTTSTPPPPQEQLQQPGTVVRDLVRWWQSVDVLVAAATGPSSAVARGLERQAEAAARLKVLGAVTADAVRAATKQAIENLHETPPTLPNFTLPKLTLPTITLPSLNFTLPSFSLPQAIDAPIMMNPAVRERAAMFARARTEVASSPLMQLLPLLAAGAHAGPAGVLQAGQAFEVLVSSGEGGDVLARHPAVFGVLAAARDACRGSEGPAWRVVHAPDNRQLLAAARTQVPALLQDMSALPSLQPLSQLLEGCTEGEVLAILVTLDQQLQAAQAEAGVPSELLHCSNSNGGSDGVEQEPGAQPEEGAAPEASPEQPKPKSKPAAPAVMYA